jgi:hypothetical protein
MSQDELSWRSAYQAYLGSKKETWSEFELSEAESGPLWPTQCAAPCLACRVSDAPKPKK